MNLFIPDDIDWPEFWNYTPNPDLKYSLDFDDGLIKCLCCIAKLSKTYKLVCD